MFDYFELNGTLSYKGKYSVSNQNYFWTNTFKFDTSGNLHMLSMLSDSQQYEIGKIVINSNTSSSNMTNHKFKLDTSYLFLE